MTHIQSIDLWTDRRSWQERLASSIGDYSSLAGRPWAEVRKIEFLPNVCVGSLTYEVPENWLPQGALRRESSRIFDPSIGALWDESIRRSLFALALPRRTLNGMRRLKPTSWLYYSRLTLRMARWSVTHRPSSAGCIWLHLTMNDWRKMLSDLCSSKRMQTRFFLIARMLEDHGQRSVISDYPVLKNKSEPKLSPDLQDDAPLEVSRRGQADCEEPGPTASSGYQPLPDTFVANIIERARWMQENLSDQLLDCWEAIRKHRSYVASLGRSRSHPQTSLEFSNIIKCVDWKDSAGRPLTHLPWSLSLKEGNRSVLTSSWPPNNAVGITMMVSTLQALNYCCVALCTGARSSEILSATDRSLTSFDDRFHAKTFKLVDEVGGADRDWPLHPVAKRALEIQKRIAEVVRPPKSEHLWVLLRDGSEPSGSQMRSVGEPLARSASIFGLNSDTGGARPHAHRWRFTVARLVALAVTSAPQVLMDLFGHRDLEMTLRYMLAHPQMAQEVMRVAAEMSYAMAAEAVADAHAGTAGGPAASALGAGIKDMCMRRGEEHFGAQTMQEAIDILTFNGRYWQLVRPGVLCTKTLGQFGPCTMGRGDADPGACHSTCVHRLEMARAKAHCETALDQLLSEHASAIGRMEELTVANLEGQILAHLARWDDVRERVLRQNGTAKQIWNARVSA